MKYFALSQRSGIVFSKMGLRQRNHAEKTRLNAVRCTRITVLSECGLITRIFEAFRQVVRKAGAHVDRAQPRGRDGYLGHRGREQRKRQTTNSKGE